MNRFGRFGSKKQNDSSDSSYTDISPSPPPPPPPPPHSPPPSTEPPKNVPEQGARISATEYAKATIQLNRRIAELGAGFEFDFPRVAVVGSQSSGKSSLVEAISGISVPRYSNTCTRCPMECTMIPDGDSWYCTINLKTTVRGATSSKRFGPSRITEKDQVELWITRAQAAILNPNRQAEFLEMDADELRRIMKEDDRFSEDVIEVEVRDPDLPPLIFVDLPGIIHHHPKSNEMITVNHKIVRSFIGGPCRNNTLMLIVMPANEDASNQKAMNMGKEYDKYGARTIGVLTKPDQIGPGDHGLKATARASLEGQGEHPLKNGYYCVRLPNDAERKEKLGPDELSSLANKLFEETEPWKDVTNRSVFGVSNLVSSISTLLVKMIRANLPKLEKQIQEELMQCRAEFQALPLPPTGRPLIQIMELVRHFSEDVNRAVMGHEHRQYAQKNRRAIYAKFRADIWRTGIDFKPDVNHTTSSVIQDTENRDESWSHSSIPEPERVSMPEFSTSMNLIEVREVILKSISWELPGHVPFQATMELVQRSTSQWREPALNCFNEVFEQSRRLFDKMIADRFGLHHSLEELIKSITHEHHQACQEDAVILLEKSIRLETHPLYTQNYHYYDSQRNKWRNHFRNAYANGSFHSPHVQEYQSEIDLMGDARAYFKVAFKRFADYIPLLIEHELSQEFAVRLYERLIERIPFHDLQKLDELMAEKSTIRIKREQLQNDISRLEEMTQLLKEYRQSGEGDGVESTEDAHETDDARSLVEPEYYPPPSPGLSTPPLRPPVVFPINTSYESLRPEMHPTHGGRKAGKGKFKKDKQ